MEHITRDNEPSAFVGLPPEVHLRILSYLDLPDLAALGHLSPTFADLVSDPLLHQERLRIVAPSRVKHSLFGVSAKGIPLRPTVGDLVQRGVIRGLGIERRWRMGTYFYSSHSIVQYENSRRLARIHASDVLSGYLKRRPRVLDHFLQSLHKLRVIPDVESPARVSRSLLPTLHKLKWSLLRDRLAKLVRDGSCVIARIENAGTGSGKVDFGTWLERRARGIVREDERIRLAMCPNTKKIIQFYESLSHTG